MIEKEEFNAWLQHPVTEALRALLNAKREELRQAWEGGSFTDYEKDGTILTNVGNMGTCKGYAFVAELDYETFESEVGDGEPKRTETVGRGRAGRNV
jgi:hypothetical protein